MRYFTQFYRLISVIFYTPLNQFYLLRYSVTEDKYVQKEINLS